MMNVASYSMTSSMKVDKKNDGKKSSAEKTKQKEARVDRISSTKVKNQKNKYKVQDSEVTSTTPTTRAGDLAFCQGLPNRKFLLIKPGAKWFENGVRTLI